MESIHDLLNLSGKTAIVTGGASGIGLGISRRLAEAGASVVVADRIKEEGMAAAEELKSRGWKAKAVSTDVSIEESVRRMAEVTVTSYGGVDILVNNAGIYPLKPVLEMSVADFEQVIAINLKGVSSARSMSRRG